MLFNPSLFVNCHSDMKDDIKGPLAILFRIHEGRLFKAKGRLGLSVYGCDRH